MLEYYALVNNKYYNQPEFKINKIPEKLPPITCELNIRCITSSHSRRVLAGLTSVHNLDDYIRKSQSIDILPEIHIELDKLLQGGGLE